MNVGQCLLLWQCCGPCDGALLNMPVQQMYICAGVGLFRPVLSSLVWEYWWWECAALHQWDVAQQRLLRARHQAHSASYTIPVDALGQR